MPNITRSIQPTTGNSKTKVLLVRQPVRSVRREDEASRLPVRLAIGTLAAVGGLALLWVMGYAGFRLGFASVIGVPELSIDAGGGLATSARVIVGLPMRIVEAGVAEPLWLMVAFGLIAIPAGGLAGVRPRTPGGPRPSALFTLFTWTGAIAACLAAAVVIAYVLWPVRLAWTTPLPRDLAGVDGWLDAWRTAAGFDGLVALAAGVWVVLAMRLQTPRWMKGLCGSATIFAFLVIVIAMGVTNATAAHLEAPRSTLALGAEDEQTSILVGYTPHHAVILQASDGEAWLEMFDVPTQVRLAERRSIAATLVNAMPPEGF